MVNQVKYFGKKDAVVNKSMWARPTYDFFMSRAYDLRPEIYHDKYVVKIVQETKELNLRLAKMFAQ